VPLFPEVTLFFTGELCSLHQPDLPWQVFLSLPLAP
jgi:hypothetical protein